MSNRTDLLGASAVVWRWRRLAIELAGREFKARYAGSALGIAWAFLEPALQFALYLVVFSVFLGIKLDNKPGVGAFALYLISGLVPFNAFAESIARAAGFAREKSALVRHVNVPLEVLLAGALLAVFGRQAIALALAAAIAGGTGLLVWSHLPWLVAGVVVVMVASWGSALGLVPVGAFLPDLSQALGTAITVLFYLTPIVYPASVVPKWAAGMLALNPLTGALDLFRAAFIGQNLTLRPVVLALAAAVVALVIGNLIFVYRARAVRDIV